MTRVLYNVSRRVTRSGESCSRFYASSLCRGRYTSTATAVEDSAVISLPQEPPTVAASIEPRQLYRVHAGIILSRPPILTRDLHPFEKAFFLYQRRLNERTALPFTRYFYYAKDTPGDVDWKKKIKDRQAAARDIGVYNAYRNDPWHDEVLVGAKESEPEHQIEALLKDATTTKEDSAHNSPVEQAELEGLANKKKQETVEAPLPRVTEADKTHDTRSLNRKLARTLYLVVNGERGWEFPSGKMEENEPLHRAAERLMVQAGGINMNTWLVANHPVGHYRREFDKAQTDVDNVEFLGEKTFFLKARIMAGQANISRNSLGLDDFQWLAKEELQTQLPDAYYRSIKNTLAEI